MTVELAAVVLAHNNEQIIGECIDSLAWAEDRVVFDDFSTDETAPIARAHGARVIQHSFEDFAAQRNAALEAVEARWIFFVDSDERATPALAQEVLQVIRYDGEAAREGWWVPRFNYMIGHRMRGGGWYPDHQLRLLLRDRAHYDPAHPVHEIVVLDGEPGYLENELIHHNYETVGDFRRKMDQYASLEARILAEQGVRVRPWTYASMPVREFWRRFVNLRGYRDHGYGLLFCGLMSWYTLVSYQRLRALRGNK